MKEVIEHLERMAETLDGVTEENWLDTPEDIAQIYRSVANEIKQKMSAQNQSVTNCNQLQPNKVENAENNHIRLNADKMSDALRKVISLYKSWASSGDKANDYLISACNVAMEALSDPPRNCDRKYRNAYEVIGRFVEDTNPVKVKLEEVINWLLFAEEKGEAK